MASTEGLVSITRRFLASYYDKYPFAPLPDDVSRLSSEIRSITSDLLKDSPPRSQEIVLLKEAEGGLIKSMRICGRIENIWKKFSFCLINLAAHRLFKMTVNLQVFLASSKISFKRLYAHCKLSKL